MEICAICSCSFAITFFIPIKMHQRWILHKCDQLNCHLLEAYTIPYGTWTFVFVIAQCRKKSFICDTRRWPIFISNETKNKKYWSRRKLKVNRLEHFWSRFSETKTRWDDCAFLTSELFPIAWNSADDNLRVAFFYLATGLFQSLTALSVLCLLLMANAWNSFGWFFGDLKRPSEHKKICKINKNRWITFKASFGLWIFDELDRNNMCFSKARWMLDENVSKVL